MAGSDYITQDAEQLLNELNPRARVDYERYKENIEEWMLSLGKNPERRRGYAETTTRRTVIQIDSIYCWKWQRESAYSRDFTPEDADDFMAEKAADRSQSDSTLLTYVKTIKRIFKYRSYTSSREEIDWECSIKLSESNPRPRDYFRKEELPKLYTASLSSGSVKHYHSCTPEERDELKAHLAQRFEKPKESIVPDDFDRANSWKIPSIMAVTLDTGLRPIEVGRAKVDWFDLERSEMNVPKEESTKSYENWGCGISRQSVDALRMWLDERESYGKYSDSKSMWLNKHGNSYNSRSLNRILTDLIEEAGIEPEGRQLTWYSIRHGVATVWANEFGLQHAKEQMRHKKIETTIRYVHSDPESRSEKADHLY